MKVKMIDSYTSMIGIYTTVITHNTFLIHIIWELDFHCC